MRIELADQELDAGALLNAFLAAQDGAGATVSFTGTVRSEGGEVVALELEAYPGFTEAEIARTAEAAAARFGLLDLFIAHRTGRVGVGGVIVFLATAARNRRAAFEGADFLMDYLKSRAPFWKKSHERNGGRWILPRPEDYQDAARWGEEEIKP